jgi:tryptophan-rich sensory protein
MSRASTLRSLLVLAGFLIAAFGVAALGGIATASSVSDWYPTLVKPSWNPPSWLFGPVWTLLYIAMSVVAWRIWRLPAGTDRTLILRAWWVQLALNAAWSWAFFYLRIPAAGLLVIGPLLVVVAWIQPRLARNDRPSAMLWTPYVLWIAFASCLNLALWHLN